MKLALALVSAFAFAATACASVPPRAVEPASTTSLTNVEIAPTSEAPRFGKSQRAADANFANLLGDDGDKQAAIKEGVRKGGFGDWK